ncbi:MAG: hypothetical protein KAJ19_00490 [Gammaproteobacteria bacterium]|nr:hypothetical protein [Gammaproteobacteria bacterium]
MDMPDPYKSTTIAPGKTQGQINDLLRVYGCKSMRWTELDAEDGSEMIGQTEHPLVVIEFNAPNQAIEEKTNKRTPRRTKAKPKPPRPRVPGIERMLGVRIVFPVPAESMRPQMFRIIYYSLKTKLASVQHGITTFEQEFFSDIVVDGDKTIWELAGGNAVTGEIKKMPSRLAIGPGK